MHVKEKKYHMLSRIEFVHKPNLSIYNKISCSPKINISYFLENKKIYTNTFCASVPKT